MRKSWRIQGTSETCLIAPRSLVSQEEQAAYLSSQLDHWLKDPLTRKAVLDIYESIRGQSALLARRLQGQELHRYVKSELLQAFRRGELVLMRLPHLTILPNLELSREQEQTVAEEPPPTQEQQKQKTWVGIELVDQDGNPVPQANYVLELPDGTRKKGKLDENGTMQVRDIDPGTCKVWFPDYDASEWEGGNSSSDQPPANGEKSWVELELVDEDGKPVPNARYQLCFSDGTERSGTLGDDGRGREEGIQAGTCKVTFPDYDAAEWDAV